MEEIKREIEKLNSRLDSIEEALRLLLIRETISDIQSRTGIDSSAKMPVKYIKKKDIAINDKVKIKSGSKNYFGGSISEENFSEIWIVSKIYGEKVTLKNGIGNSMIVKTESLENLEVDTIDENLDNSLCHNEKDDDSNIKLNKKIKKINNSIKKINTNIKTQKKNIEFLWDNAMINKLKGILSQELHIEVEYIFDSDYLIEDLGVSHSVTSELIQDVNKEFNVKLPEDFFEKERTVYDFYTCIKMNEFDLGVTEIDEASYTTESLEVDTINEKSSDFNNNATKTVSPSFFNRMASLADIISSSIKNSNTQTKNNDLYEKNCSYKILKIISKHLDVDMNDINIYDTASDLRIDSLDLIDIVMAIEEEFNVEISDEKMNEFFCVKDVIDYVMDNSELKDDDLYEYYISDSCISCGVCAEICPVKAVSSGSDKYIIKTDICIGCGACEGECPVNAILKR